MPIEIGASIGLPLALASIALIGTVARLLLDLNMRKVSGPTQSTGNVLAPAEMAFLLRNGDMAHTLIVLSVDLMQRVLKQNAPLPTKSYEQQVWLSIKDGLKQAAEEKAGHLVPVKNIKNPLEWAMRYNGLKRFFGETLRSFIRDVAKDPRQLRKYFSAAGVARLAVHMYASSLRGSVERELHSELLGRNLLVPTLRRKNFATAVLLMIPLLVLGAFTANGMLAFVPQSVFTGFLLIGLVNAVALYAVASLPGFIPTYEEFAQISAELQRSSKRLTLVRALLKASRAVVVGVLLVVYAILASVQLAISALVLHIPLGTALPLLLSTSLLGAVIAKCAMNAHSWLLFEQPTEVAISGLSNAKAALTRLSPLNTLTNAMANPDYDPEFSRLVAYYGIETLWLLG